MIWTVGLGKGGKNDGQIWCFRPIFPIGEKIPFLLYPRVGKKIHQANSKL